jgi:hypothetical protein
LFEESLADESSQAGAGDVDRGLAGGQAEVFVQIVDAEHLPGVLVGRGHGALVDGGGGGLRRCRCVVGRGEAVDDPPGGGELGQAGFGLVFAAQPHVPFRLPDRNARRDEVGSPGPWDADMFEIVSDRMPTCWVTALNDGRLTLAPQEWQRTGFREDFFDHLPDALAEFDRLKAQIISES